MEERLRYCRIKVPTICSITETEKYDVMELKSSKDLEKGQRHIIFQGCGTALEQSSKPAYSASVRRFAPAGL